MAKLFISSLILLVGIVANSRANSIKINSPTKTFILNNSSQIGSIWSTDCDYFSSIEVIPSACIGAISPDANSDGGYWGKCDEWNPFEREICSIVFEYEEDFIPESIHLNTFIYDSTIRVWTAINSNLRTFTGDSTQWINNNLQIEEMDLGSDRKIHFEIEIEFAGYFSLFLNSIGVYGTDLAPDVTTPGPTDVTDPAEPSTPATDPAEPSTEASTTEHAPGTCSVNTWTNSTTATQVVDSDWDGMVRIITTTIVTTNSLQQA